MSAECVAQNIAILCNFGSITRRINLLEYPILFWNAWVFEGVPIVTKHKNVAVILLNTQQIQPVARKFTRHHIGNFLYANCNHN